MELGGHFNMRLLRRHGFGPRGAEALFFRAPQVKELINTHDDTSQYTERSSIESSLYYPVFINLPLPGVIAFKRMGIVLVSLLGWHNRDDP
jgi:hypothetical protein